MTQGRFVHRRWFGVASLVAVGAGSRCVWVEWAHGRGAGGCIAAEAFGLPGEPGLGDRTRATDDPEFDAAVEACEQAHDPTVGATSTERDSDNFTHGELVTVGSTASLVPDEEVRDELFVALDTLVDCLATAVEEALINEAAAGATVAVSDPYAVDVSTSADRTEGRAIQLGIGSETHFMDLIVMEQASTLLQGWFLHSGDLTLQAEEEILAPAVERMKEM